MIDQVYGDDISVEGLRRDISALQKYVDENVLEEIVRIAILKSIEQLKVDVAIMEAEQIQTNPKSN